jgi:RNA polymerase sigma-70 factor (ECF subfamily)
MEFNQLWDELNKKLLGYIKSKVNNQHDAEDILQDVFVKVYSNIDTLEKKTAVKSWIYSITRNTIIDFYKKKKDVSLSPEKFHDLEEELYIEDNLNEDISRCLSNMIFSFPDKYQDVYEMYEKDDMKHKDIAEALDISVSASKVRLKRAKEMFKTMLVNCCDFEVDKYGNIIDYHKKGQCDTCEDC